MVRRYCRAQTVLTQGAGGVSLFALQLARLFGARVIATTSSDSKAERLLELGADAVVDYRKTPDWHAKVRELNGGRGVDVIVEVGGAGTMEQSLKAVAFSGQISQVGWLDKSASSISIAALSATVITVRRIAVGSRAQFRAMNNAIAMHGLKPVIDSVFPFEDALAAFRHYARGNTFGKIVIRHDETLGGLHHFLVIGDKSCWRCHNSEGSCLSMASWRGHGPRPSPKGPKERHR